MKLKIIIVLIFFMIISALSYFTMNNNKINYTILGDKSIFSNNIISKNFSDLIYEELNKKDNFNSYNEDFILDDIRIIDLINQIKENKSITDKSIQNVLKNTNLLILNIGNNELNYKLSKIDQNENNDKEIYDYLDEVIKDYIKLLKLIKVYNNGKFIILSNYNDTNNENNDKYYEYLNKNIQNYCKNNKIEFINIANTLNKNKGNLTKNMPVYITNKGNLALFNTIYSKIDNLYLHKIY